MADEPTEGDEKSEKKEPKVPDSVLRAALLRRARGPKGLGPDATALRDALKLRLAASQDRTVDVLRRWDADNSGTIDQREVRARRERTP